ncbi:MAG: hypothetical protein ACKPHU_23090 [Planctomycetaceae bacterium]
MSSVDPGVCCHGLAGDLSDGLVSREAAKGGAKGREETESCHDAHSLATSVARAFQPEHCLVRC